MMARLLPAPLVGVLTFVLKFFVLIFWFTLMLPGVLQIGRASCRERV